MVVLARKSELGVPTIAIIRVIWSMIIALLGKYRGQVYQGTPGDYITLCCTTLDCQDIFFYFASILTMLDNRVTYSEKVHSSYFSPQNHERNPTART